MKFEEEEYLRNYLIQLRVIDLRELCYILKISRGGSKPNLIEKVIDSDYNIDDIIKTAGFILLMIDVLNAFNKKFFTKILNKAGISYRAKKEKVALCVIEYDLITPKELLKSVRIDYLKNLYYKRIGKASTKSTLETIYEILVSYGLKPRDNIELEKEITAIGSVGNYVFVLMPFTTDLTFIYREIIKPTVEGLNYICKRADDFFTANKIMDDIEKAIREAVIIIADLSGKNPNVFYEVGMSHILKKKVILIAQSNDDIPFDLRQWRHIKYNTSKQGLIKLKKDIEKTIKEIT